MSDISYSKARSLRQSRFIERRQIGELLLINRLGCSSYAVVVPLKYTFEQIISMLHQVAAISNLHRLRCSTPRSTGIIRGAVARHNFNFNTRMSFAPGSRCLGSAVGQAIGDRIGLAISQHGARDVAVVEGIELSRLVFRTGRESCPFTRLLSWLAVVICTSPSQKDILRGFTVMAMAVEQLEIVQLLDASIRTWPDVVLFPEIVLPEIKATVGTFSLLSFVVRSSSAVLLLLPSSAGGCLFRGNGSHEIIHTKQMRGWIPCCGGQRSRHHQNSEEPV